MRSFSPSPRFGLDTRVGTVEPELLPMTGVRQSVLRQCVSEGCSSGEVPSRLDLPPAVVGGHLQSGLRTILARLAGPAPAIGRVGAA